MALFRSEEHVARWCEQVGRPEGAVFSVDSLWRLAHSWFHDRLSPTWRRATMDEAHAIFHRAGLEGPFWRLDG